MRPVPRGVLSVAYTEACSLIEGIDAGALLADHGYDTNEIVDKAREVGGNIINGFDLTISGFIHKNR